MDKYVNDLKIISSKINLNRKIKTKMEFKDFFDEDLNDKLSVFRIDSFLGLKEGISLDKEKHFEYLIKNIINIEESEVFNYYFLINKMGFWGGDDAHTVLKELIERKNEKIILKSIVEFLNNFEYKAKSKDVKDLLLFQRGLSYEPSFFSQGDLLATFIYLAPKFENYIYILEQLKEESFILYLLEASNHPFINNISEILKLKDKLVKEPFKNNFLLNLIYSQEAFLSYINVETENNMIELFKEHKGHYTINLFREIYFNQRRVEHNPFFNKIFTKLLECENEEIEFLDILNWGNDIEKYSLFLIYNDIVEENRLKRIAYKYFKIFLTNYMIKREEINGFFDFYYSFEPKSEFTHSLLGYGFILSKDEGTSFLDKEFRKIKYEFYTRDITTKFNLVKKSLELVMMLFLIGIRVTNMNKEEMQVFKTMIEIFEKTVLEQLLINMEVLDNFSKQREGLSKVVINFIETEKENHNIPEMTRIVGEFNKYME